MHAVGTAEVVREHLGDPLLPARRHDEMSEAGVRPDTGTRSSLTGRGRSRSMRPSTAARPGLRADPAVLLRGALTVAMMEDADLFRAFAGIVGMLELPRQVMACPGLADRIMRIAGGRRVVKPPGPARDHVPRMLA
jgi:hypothetical protein